MTGRSAARALGVVALALGLAARPAGARARPTLQERLGHPKDARLVIVHADDLGEWHSVNAAALRAFETGLVNSGSAMPACPWFPEIAGWSREHPEADLGLHLAVTSERTAYRWGPVASRERIPSLLDPGGYLQLVQVEAAKRADAREVEVELRAQVDRALHLGMRPTHLDSHQAVLYQRPDLFEALVRVSRDYRIPLGLARSHVEAHPFMAAILGMDPPLVDRAFDIPPSVPAEKWADWYEAEIRGLGPGVTQIVMHPGLADAELVAATADRPTWGAAWRQRDFDFFTSDRFRRLVREQELVFTTWRAVASVASPATTREQR